MHSNRGPCTTSSIRLRTSFLSGGSASVSLKLYTETNSMKKAVLQCLKDRYVSLATLYNHSQPSKIIVLQHVRMDYTSICRLRGVLNSVELFSCTVDKCAFFQVVLSNNCCRKCACKARRLVVFSSTVYGKFRILHHWD